MLKFLLFVLFTIPLLVEGQNLLAKRYVDDRINSLTYLSFQSNGTFEYKYTYDLIHDSATGSFIQQRDTIFLNYNRDATNNSSIEKSLYNVKELRADTLILKDHKLFEVKNGISSFNLKPIVIDYKTHKGWKPPKSWHYRHKFLIFGPYQSTKSGRYYMIDEQFSPWGEKDKSYR